MWAPAAPQHLAGLLASCSECAWCGCCWSPGPTSTLQKLGTDCARIHQRITRHAFGASVCPVAGTGAALAQHCGLQKHSQEDSDPTGTSTRFGVVAPSTWKDKSRLRCRRGSCTTAWRCAESHMTPRQRPLHRDSTQCLAAAHLRGFPSLLRLAAAREAASTPVCGAWSLHTVLHSAAARGLGAARSRSALRSGRTPAPCGSSFTVLLLQGIASRAAPT